MKPECFGTDRAAIGRMFSNLAPEYRRFNRWTSLGLDETWRQNVVREVVGARWVLDLGTGTGDLAWSVLAGPSPLPRVAAMDISADMLHHAERQGWIPKPLWVQAGGDQLPFRAGTFDVVVSAYVLRNLLVGGVLDAVLRECVRVLTPEGRIVFLDLTRPDNALLRWGHGLYNRTILPMVGRWVFGPRWPGRYLCASIEALPSTGVLEQRFLAAGFKRFERRPLWGGIVSLFIGSR